MLKFAKVAPYLPDPVRSRPNITPTDRARAAEKPPHFVPFHCKPWLDGQGIGWTLFYGFAMSVTIVGTGDGNIVIENLELLARETNQPDIITQFTPGYWAFGIGYTLQTPPSIISLFIPATNAPDGLELVPCVIETDWYPRQLFMVFRAPPAGTRVALTHATEVARVVPVPRLDAAAAEPLTDDELQVLRERRAAYSAEEATTPTRWTAASGDQFTHTYKLWSGRYRRGEGE